MTPGILVVDFEELATHAQQPATDWHNIEVFLQFLY